MKKYILFMFAVIAAFTSCTNDDITISQATNFKINPSTVIAPFTFEWNDGDLETFDSAYKLRVQLLIYNDKGVLAEKVISYGENYSTMVNTNVYLPYGRYTAVAITDVVKYNNGEVTFSYWDLKNENKLTEAKIDDTGYFTSERGILGIAKKQFEVSENYNSTQTINVEPAGALFLSTLYNPFYYSDVERIGVETNKNGENYNFDSFGNYNVAQETASGDFDWWMFFIDLEDYETEYSMIYGYYFIPTMNNYGMRFVADTDEQRFNLSGITTVNIKQGEEYWLLLDLYDEELEGSQMECFLVNDESEKASVTPYTDKMLQKIGADVFTQCAVNDGIYLKNVK